MKMRRLLSIILCLCMFVSVFSMSAMASDIPDTPDPEVPGNPDPDTPDPDTPDPDPDTPDPDPDTPDPDLDTPDPNTPAPAADTPVFTATLGSYSGVYDGSNHIDTHVYLFIVDGNGNDVKSQFEWNRPEMIHAGTYTIYITGKATGTYAGQTAALSYTVTQAPVTVTAQSASKTFGTADPVFGYTATGLVGSEQLSGSLSRTAGEASGTYQINAGNLVASNPNYDITFIPADFVIITSAAESVVNKILGLSWLPDGQVDPGNSHQRSAVLSVWNAYNSLSYAEQLKVPAELYNWLYYLVSNTDYAIIAGNGQSWYKGKSSGTSFTAIDPKNRFAGVRVDGELIDSSNYDYYWYGDNAYGYNDLVVITLKPSYLTNLGFGQHSISICYWNGYAPGYFYVMEADGSPPTGDSANFPLWGSMMLISALGLAAAAGFVFRRKKNEG